MTLQPFVAVDGVSFGISPAALLRARGSPLRRGRNGIGLHEFDYADAVFRFQDCGRLEEITTRAPVLRLGRVVVPFDGLVPFVRSHDPFLFERAGFLVSAMLGFAFAPRCPGGWVTALAAHCIGEWRAL